MVVFYQIVFEIRSVYILFAVLLHGIYWKYVCMIILWCCNMAVTAVLVRTVWDFLHVFYIGYFVKTR